LSAQPISSALFRRSYCERSSGLADSSPVGQPVDVFVSDSNIWVRSGDRTIVGRKVSGKFPDVFRMVPKSFDHETVVSVPELRSMLTRMFPFTEGESKPVIISISNGSMTAKAGSSETECEDSIAVEGGTIDLVKMNSRYIKDFLGAAADAERIRILYNNRSSAFKFEPVSGGGMYGVIMPMAV
jgi:DNA polymerase III sliding clamp (beta) subunit (PCNA family)